MVTKKKRPLQAIRDLSPKKRIVIFTIFDLFFSLGVPVILIIIKYDIFLAYQEAGTQATGWLYIFLLLLISGIIWRGKAILTYTRSNGLKYALTKSLLPFIFLLFYVFLGYAENNIERLRFITLWSAMSHFVAIYFRYLVGKATKDLEAPVTTP